MSNTTSPAHRIDALEKITGGDLALRDFLGLDGHDTDAMAYLGKVAFDSGRFDEAVTIFTALASLEPDVPDHAFCIAEVEVRRNNVVAAVEWISKYLDNENVSARRSASALLFRASLTQESNPTASNADIELAKRIAERSEEAAQVVKAVLR